MLADGSRSYAPGVSSRSGSSSTFYHFDTSGDLGYTSDGSGNLNGPIPWDGFHVGISNPPVPVGSSGGDGGYTDPDTGDVNLGGGSIAPVEGWH